MFFMNVLVITQLNGKWANHITYQTHQFSFKRRKKMIVDLHVHQAGFSFYIMQKRNLKPVEICQKYKNIRKTSYKY